MGAIDEVRRDGNRVTVFVEGASTTFEFVNGRPRCVASSGKYKELFRWRPACQVEHEKAAMEEFSKPFREEVPNPEKMAMVSKAKKRKRKKKEVIDPYDRHSNPRPVNPASFPVGKNGEYIGLSISVIYNSVAALYRKNKLGGFSDYKEAVAQALKNMGFTGKNLGAIRSALSKEMWRRRKEKKAAAEKKRIDDARQAEFEHFLPAEN